MTQPRRRAKTAAPTRQASAAATGTVKRSVTLERRWDAEAHHLVGDRGFSEFVNDAVKRAVQRELLERDLAQYEAAHGKIPADVYARAEESVKRYLRG